MKFNGDKRDQFPIGKRLGPDASGLMHEVTSVWYDGATHYTHVRTRKLEVGDRRLRFVGGRE
ncbi:hypothetical protein 32HC_65 [Mycobacterium phage 32HC]|uniref:Uncharacterized protein n=1 Tax=Mycobacterium phage 32HC TaxID=1445729 RepID=W8EAG0_9CAUD|nr:hypothetical protein ST32HC_65 [Mycobacterium phage 32HC]AHJ86343.1 hypothetical protein 32HC_65 [Mycobacterium phage 32HC]